MKKHADKDIENDGTQDGITVDVNNTDDNSTDETEKSPEMTENPETTSTDPDGTDDTAAVSAEGTVAEDTDPEEQEDPKPQTPSVSFSIVFEDDAEDDDTTNEDTAIGFTTDADTPVEDAAVEDTAVEDTAINPTAAEPDVPGGAATADTTRTDTAGTDTAEADTALPDSARGKADGGDEGNAGQNTKAADGADTVDDVADGAGDTDVPTAANTGTSALRPSSSDPLMKVSSRINAEIHQRSRLRIDEYPVLSFKGITYFPKKSRYAILDRIDWSFYAGHLQTVLTDSDEARMAIMGLLSGLLLPTEGQVELRGKNLTEMEPSEYRGHRVGIMFQQYSSRDELSALDNLVLTMEASGRNFLKPMPVVAKEVLERTDFPKDLINDPISTVDPVNRRRAEIARTLCCDATVLILDEPTGGLEQEQAASIMKLLTGLTQENRRCVVVLTSQDDIAQYGETTYEA
ncbi:ATP-binding cassette domain-containing protein [Bifidobacterium psychraerophilum]|uniref:ATP-binding cassette domain-containing protein n=1 Tax=Bifidobacterium psychraerophilum TaxID=218140 RepID=UPI0023F557E0|nr:ATP-binding cassette domain-containing protein [Bifidobacterium psychraerophilum]MCI1660807.1 ATP-binding cassette domain-containing protein [Bifidobacterium psychraerophilum]MCI1804773.1 ATP-binding cassette domain-containing protein [Bifidobacterium psychraerophilum]MCI2177307.1 ATP-binding cassette domain-containing protein [Bifidobacterium psychraerophilum]MCI2182241.1 ATP-binding cassette domain-containing protein [Bifidobacterium psychraerophilum]